MKTPDWLALLLTALSAVSLTVSCWVFFRRLALGDFSLYNPYWPGLSLDLGVVAATLLVMVLLEMVNLVRASDRRRLLLSWRWFVGTWQVLVGVAALLDAGSCIVTAALMICSVAAARRFVLAPRNALLLTRDMRKTLSEWSAGVSRGLDGAAPEGE